MLSIVCAFVFHPTISIWSPCCAKVIDHTLNLSLSHITNNALLSLSVDLCAIGVLGRERRRGGGVWLQGQNDALAKQSDPYLDFLVHTLSVRSERWCGRLTAR